MVQFHSLHIFDSDASCCPYLELWLLHLLVKKSKTHVWSPVFLFYIVQIYTENNLPTYCILADGDKSIFIIKLYPICSAIYFCCFSVCPAKAQSAAAPCSLTSISNAYFKKFDSFNEHLFKTGGMSVLENVYSRIGISFLSLN